MPSCALMYCRTASGSSWVDGVPYAAIGMLPSVVITSASTARSSGMPATANPVASAGDLLPGKVGHDHHAGGHEPLRHALWRRQDPCVIEPDADVAVVARHV